MSLCRRCGLCCDGTLFAWVTVAAGEIEPLRSLGLPVVQRPDGSPALRQPCPALSGRDCTVYAARPGPCRQFRCQQLIALEEGEIDLSEASAVVDRAHREIGGLSVDAVRRQVAAGTASPGARSALARIEALLARDFLGRARRA